MADYIYVSNKDRTKATTLHSADKDSVNVPPGVVNQKVDAKFNWNLPKNIILKTEQVRSTSPLPKVEVPERDTFLPPEKQRMVATNNVADGNTAAPLGTQEVPNPHLVSNPMPKGGAI